MASDQFIQSGNSFFGDVENYLSSQITGTANFFLVNGCTRGAGTSQRVGQQIQLARVRATGIINAAAGGTVRCGFVIDRNNNGGASVPAAGSVFEGANLHPVANQNPLTSSRYEIVHDELRSPTGSSANTPLCVSIDIPLEGWTTTYNAASTGAQSDIQTNALFFFVMFCALPPTVTPAIPNLLFNLQLTYYP